MPANNWRRRLDDRLDEKPGTKPPQDLPRREKPDPPQKSAQPSKPRDRKTVADIRREQPSSAQSPGVKSKPIPSASLVPHSRALSLLPLPQSDLKDYHSLRAAVLITFIILGMAVGFLYNISRDDSLEPEPVKSPQKTQLGDEAAVEQTDQEIIAQLNPAALIPSDSINKDVTASMIKEAKEQLGEYSGLEVFLDVNSGEYPTLLPKEPYGGLTGANAPPPEFASQNQGNVAPLSPGLPLEQKRLAPDIDMDF